MKKAIIPILGVSLVLSACGGATSDSAKESTAAKTSGVTVTNCGEEVTFDKANELFVNDGNIISIALAAGASDKIKYVSSLQRDKEILRAKFGEHVDSLNETSKDYPSLEAVVAKHPDVFMAGWNYGFSEEKNLTPESLKAQGISSYILSESCKQSGSDKRGVYDPWEAVQMDISNIGAITNNNKETAESSVKDLTDRLESLKKLKTADKKPNVFVFDSGRGDAVYTSGKFGAPQAILEAAGAQNASGDIEDTWTSVGWEKIASATPDAFVFVDYPGQEFNEKVEELRANPATKNLPAVKENRFINLPYTMWTSGSLNIDAAEHVRKGLEKFNLAPQSEMTPKLTLPSSVAGQEFVS
ncbi:ABC transporter substrate-binding protein [Corynebacterium silvaticum]|uniref:ABC transporter substrate-binding protein n=1 Tax=Corynebacterium silvaticum TaxID=2320431 RepID=A0A7U5K8S4_9CORY|nr:ABC transporter substrate-binding protein [Corynebacterium silvaticum]ARU46002.1 ABC transporter substrate-binding protein [Corynebacterium silvaticum]UWH01117.1 ABC transporter substrate-binding protein [Corynebacterium silvaticum]UWH03355.1 ABC transporter substrate-binding protein [Corynebacterium silvaticum]UWH05393.1 ABC transporter substrate-binding protein [Corynebacterium silvaticum]UXZ27555.1 ABC transporter substrate-binding protein [Corynebacterium silvaticum]